MNIKDDGMCYGPKYMEEMKKSFYESALDEAGEKDLRELLMVLAGYVPDGNGNFDNPVRRKRQAASIRLRKNE